MTELNEQEIEIIRENFGNDLERVLREIESNVLGITEDIDEITGSESVERLL